MKGNTTNPKEEEKIDPKRVRLVAAWISGYYSGYEAGFKSAGQLLQSVDKRNAPFPKRVRAAMVEFGKALEITAAKAADDEFEERRARLDEPEVEP